jgi:hypothetical protein
MTVAALALPMPKFTIVMSPAVAVGIGFSLPWTGTLWLFAKRSTYLMKFVRRMYLPNFSSGTPV